jgi:hypothetical protein
MASTSFRCVRGRIYRRINHRAVSLGKSADLAESSGCMTQSENPAPARAAPLSLSSLWALIRRVPAEAACFVLVAGVYLVHLFTSGYDRFYYDSADYWEQYSFRSRGYSMPLLCRVLQGIGSAFGLGDVTIVKIFGALLAATLGVVVVPRLARQLFPAAAVTWLRVLALNALVFLYWRDYFAFPLTDFPALLLASVAVLALLRRNAAGLYVAGLALGVAVNLRPNYLPALAAVLVVAAHSVRPRHGTLATRAVALVLAGAFVATVPQVLANHHWRGSWSPIVERAHEEELVSIWLGMNAQKFETYIGTSDVLPSPNVAYLDPSTIRLLDREHISPVRAPDGVLEFPGTRRYLRLVVHHPAEMAASYVRHVFNGLDVRHPTPYIRDFGDTSLALSLLEYSLLFLALARLLVPRARRALGDVRWGGVIVLAGTCVSTVVIQAEVRYWLPWQFLVYMLVCFGPAFGASLLGRTRGDRVAIGATYVAFVLLCLTLSAASQAQRQYPSNLSTSVSRAAEP